MTMFSAVLRKNMLFYEKFLSVDNHRLLSGERNVMMRGFLTVKKGGGGSENE